MNTTRKQKVLDETLIVSNYRLPKDPAKTLMKPVHTTTAKHTDSATVTGTVKKIKASSIKAKHKPSPAITTHPVSPKVKAATKKGSLREQIELFTQSARDAASLSQTTLTGALCQNHPVSTDDLTCNHLDHNPTMMPTVNNDRLGSKTNRQERLSVDHISSMLDHLYVVGPGLTAAPPLDHSSANLGVLAPKTNPAHSATINLSQTVPVNVSKCIAQPSFPSLSTPSTSPRVTDQRDPGPQSPILSPYLPAKPSLPLSPFASSSIMSSWTPTRDVAGMEATTETILPYQMVGMKIKCSPRSLTWSVLVGLMLHASSWLTPFLPPSPPKFPNPPSNPPPPYHPPTLSGPPLSLPLPTVREKLTTANDDRISQRAKLTGPEYVTEQKIIGALSVGEVRLKELPGWVAIRASCNPRQRAQAQPRSWQWYYRTYVNGKGGLGSMAMLLGGYCILSYTWNCPQHSRTWLNAGLHRVPSLAHIEQDRGQRS
ncbi:hypothetical protein DPEC_G00330340 [Dallia pectoralis]|uniref:Uncharacterized protein n=1 Tax=Dallia pectoralis TaxID=75939 RepID=A0ACC2F8X8_DALPE|nr:hypothetical protein DPEC_G00330340 [Dallia pectoralis]